MKGWIFLGLGIASLWLQLTVAPLASLFGVKPNLVLLTVVLAGLRWQDPWLFVYGALTGLGMDVFSHGNLGVYGTTFLLVSLLTLYTARSVYENNLWFTMLAVAGLTLAEGVMAITIFEILDPRTQWWDWLFKGAVPLAVYHGLLAPPARFFLLRAERQFRNLETFRTRL